MAKAAAQALLDDQSRLGTEYIAELTRVTFAAVAQGLMIQERLIATLDFVAHKFAGNGAPREQFLKFAAELFDGAKEDLTKRKKV